MNILHRYITAAQIRNLVLTTMILVVVFILFDFFDRIDNILEESPPILLIVQYFLYKIPITFITILPISVMIATIFTIGIFSKNSEITAIRSSGLRILWLAKPILLISLFLSLFSFIISETIVPHCQRRVREIYNLDIKAKNLKGQYSKSDIWWKSGDTFYNAINFDSRNNNLNKLLILKMDKKFNLINEKTARNANYINENFGWGLNSVREKLFTSENSFQTYNLHTLSLPTDKKPKDFYSNKTDPFTMSYLQLKDFVDEQSKSGIKSSFQADLYSKLSFPLIIFIITIMVIPFGLLPARSGSLANSFIYGIILAFTYYLIHSLSLALGRAEIIPVIISAWVANILMFTVGLILNLGSESPS